MATAIRGSKRPEFSVIFQARKDTLLTLGAFEEMLEYENVLYSISHTDPVSGVEYTINSVCHMYTANANGGSECGGSAKPLDFIYDAGLGKYDLAKYSSDGDDQELLKKVRQGTTEKQILGQPDDMINIHDMFS